MNLDYIIDLQRKDSTMEAIPISKPEWFSNGLPEYITPNGAGLVGNIIDFVPVDLISKRAISNDTIKLTPRLFDGYIDVNGKYHKDVPKELKVTDIMPGMRIATLFYKKDSVEWIKKCKIRGKGNWLLITDWGIVKAGSPASKTVTIKQGVNRTDTKNLSYTVGVNVKGSVDEMLNTLSTSLSKTFGSKVVIVKAANVKQDINFSPQKKDQRIGVYQFYRDYYIEPSEAMTNLTIREKGDSKGRFYHDITSNFVYKTDLYQKMYVLNPK